MTLKNMNNQSEAHAKENFLQKDLEIQDLKHQVTHHVEIQFIGKLCKICP